MGAEKSSPVVAPKAGSASRCERRRFARAQLSPDLQAPVRGFKPAQRLRKKSDFDRVYREARRSVDALFAVAFARGTGSTPRLGLSIGARAVGSAVRRNQIKRLVRESFRLHQHELPNVDIVVNARSGAREAQNDAIRRSLEKHWRQVIRKCASP